MIREEFKYFSWTAALNLSPSSPSTGWNLDFTLIQVQSYCASAFEASKMGSAKTRREATSVPDRDSPRPKVNARKCQPGIHSRSRPRPNFSISLSTAPRLNVRSLSHRGPLTSNPNSDPETQLSPDFRSNLSWLWANVFTVITDSLLRKWLVSRWYLR